MKFPVFSLLTGLPETSSLLTASSSAESATNQSPGVWASALDQWVELTNNTRMTIVEIHPFAVPGCREVRTKALCQADVVRFRQHRRRDGGPLVTP
jgi:hypothetical protein